MFTFLVYYALLIPFKGHIFVASHLVNDQPTCNAENMTQKGNGKGGVVARRSKRKGGLKGLSSDMRKCFFV
jgi:hypothetical protein